MKTAIRAGIGLARAIYALIKLFPTRNKVTFISRQGLEMPLDFRLIVDQLSLDCPRLEVQVLCRPLSKGLAGLRYLPHLAVQAYHIATSKVVVLDSYCIPVCVLRHKPALKVIQIWHAVGAFKQFGFSILDKAEARSGGGLNGYELATAMYMHQNYDLVIASSEHSAHCYAEAFNCDPSQVEIIALPRVDLLTDETRMAQIQATILASYPELGTKKNIIFAPTFRRSGSIHEQIHQLSDAIDDTKYNLIIKVHPLTPVEDEDPRAIVIREFSTLEMLSVSDYLVTDYSAITYEMLLLNKPVFFYHLDCDDYESVRGFYTPLTDFPISQFSDAHALAQAIAQDQFDLVAIKEFITGAVVHQSGNTARLTDIIKTHCHGT